jgi:hypothetical protein
LYALGFIICYDESCAGCLTQPVDCRIG